ncbi:Cof-type HAD-IIB family hydrolase [Flavimarina sp. Hel_I_48]|uniref:Cof-type HAD-IIB family hydrolase n=1 Tax=Flavimarina sp. Hel_I_48 TaxID=1392488 RepID=UPI0004DF95C1|nr:Cof-type HAD-IIB family hydrolase [Flavimarina sp. Hel_I_48]
MDLAQVRLVVSDMDGTLLNKDGKVSDRFFSLYEELLDLDVHFIAASGRQYFSIIDKLEPIKDGITVIAENGGISQRKNEVLLTMSLNRDTVKLLIEKIRGLEDAHMVLCGKRQAYVESDHSEFLSIFPEYYVRYEKVEDLMQVVEDDEFFKIAVYSFKGSENSTFPAFKNDDRDIKVKVSAENWLDISDTKTNKGKALKHVQKLLGITKEETLVLGDYNNDLEMMEEAHFSYAMQNAHPNILQAARFQTKSNNEEGVEDVLEELIAAKKKALAAKGS